MTVKIKDIAEMTGRSIQTVRNDISNGKMLIPKGKRTELTGEELESIGAYVIKHRAKR